MPVFPPTQTCAAFLGLAGDNMGPLNPLVRDLVTGRSLACGCEDAFDAFQQAMELGNSVASAVDVLGLDPGPALF